MSRKTIIFGNGLGMALNPSRFSLDKAIGTVWEDANILSDEQKQLICNCLPDDRNGRPQGEDELDKLQLALSACDFLLGIPGSRIHWLSEDGQSFPAAVRKFVHNTAKQFHLTGEVLPATFLDPFLEFIKATKSHVGMLNYDNLLYQPMIDRELLRGYCGALVDGFHDSGFNKENLVRKFGRDFGYYLHLHGSPLFVDRNSTVIKLSQFDLAQQADVISSHIVLTHFAHKPTVISASTVLMSYWQLLSEAIGESEEIVLFGYSGVDNHLNQMVKSFSDTSVRVVEWAGAGEVASRSDFWSSALGRDVQLIRLANIHEFVQWQ
ncbi:MAG: hypothetical protein J0L65_02180 [Xanthomonadales bacterium]|nr:hypothetical protein [Xanthomonadales bacterium]